MYLHALLLLGWLGMIGFGGTPLLAQKQNLYDQYFYFNSFESEADLQGWQGERRSSELDGFYCLKSNEIFSPEFDLSGLSFPVVSFYSETNRYIDVHVYTSEDGTRYTEQTVKARGIAGNYLISFPVSKTVKRIKIMEEGGHYLVIDAFCIYDSSTLPKSSEQVIFNGFETEESLNGWSFDGQRIETTNHTEKKERGDYYLGDVKSLVSPELDLTGMSEPVFSIYKISDNLLKIWISTNGTDYTEWAYRDDYNGAYYGSKIQLRLPRNTQRIKLEGGGYGAKLDAFCIHDLESFGVYSPPCRIRPAEVFAEAAGGLQWKKGGDSLVLEGSAVAGSVSRLTLLPDVYKEASLLLNIQTSDAKWFDIMLGDSVIPASGGFAVPLGESRAFHCVLKITAKTTGPVRLVISGLTYATTDLKIPMKPESWYDDITGNEGMESISAVSHDALVLFVDGVPYQYEQFEKVAGSDSWFNFVNINNDGKSDIFNSFEGNPQPCLYIRDEQGNVRKETIFAKDNTFITDINSDGRPDWFCTDGHAYIQSPDGTFRAERMRVMSREAWETEGKDDSWGPAWSGGLIISDGIPGIRDDMFIGYGPPIVNDIGNGLQSIDFNSDGRPDLLNNLSGELLLNMGHDTYVSRSLGGQIYFRDLNDDGLLDYVIYNEEAKTVKAVIEEKDGTVRQEILMQNLNMDPRMWCYDFDKDGDVDILLPFSYSDDNAAAYLVLMENDGQGHFTMHESYIKDRVLFVACADIDHDGYMDIVAKSGSRTYHGYDKTWSENYETPNHVSLYKGSREMMFTRQMTPLATFDGECLVTDVDGDGVYELVSSKMIHQLSGISANQAPERMVAPALLYDASAGYLKVSWEPGRDSESSSVDLTYALRIGSGPGKGDMLYAHAYADGKRRNLLEGNMGHDRTKVLNVTGWPAGLYYITVQAIDPVCGGSLWSEETVFEKTGVSAVFSLSTAKTTMDTVTLVYEGAFHPDYTYRWDFDGGEVFRVNADSTKYVLLWPTAGEKVVSLTVTDRDGHVAAMEKKTLDIFANKFEKGGITYDVSGVYGEGPVDLDGNGIMDVLTKKGVFEGNGKGEFTKVKKVYNTNLELDYAVTMDITGDGITDVVKYGTRYEGGREYATATSYKNMGNMTLASGVTADLKGLNAGVAYSGVLFDMDNDGKEDFYHNDYGRGVSGSIYRNTGDYLSWEWKSIEPFAPMFAADVNRDGFWDWLCVERTGEWPVYEYELALYINHGNLNIERKQLPNPFGLEQNFGISSVADMNNDGYPDLVVKKNETTIVVCLNNGNEDFNRQMEIRLPNFAIDNIVVRDFDNNGYLDLYVRGGVVYFYPGDKWKLWDYSDYSEAGLSSVLADVNGDGTLDCLMVSEYGALNLSNVTNTRPEAPANVRAVQADSSVVIEWDDTRDAETPAVQMRYNVSVKKKGATGDGAFVVSPQNGLNERAAIIPSRIYRKAPRMEMPLSALPVGEYEIQVQAIDGWDAPSPFSQVVVINVMAQPKVAVPLAVCAGQAATVRYTGTTGAEAPLWNWDGATAMATENNCWQVVWSESGVKNVTVSLGGESSTVQVFVKPQIDAMFEMNGVGVAEGEVTINLPEAILQNFSFAWKVRKDDGEWNEVYDYIQSTSSGAESYRSPVVISRRGMTREAKAVFKSKGVYFLRLILKTDCGEVTAERKITVDGALPVPEIGLVTVDATTGRNRLAWTLPQQLPEYATGLNIYKEGNRYNDFYLLATLPLSDRSYIDRTSTPEISSSRYRMSLKSSLGGESTPGTPHSSVHMMMNKGVGDSWNLIWGSYEGAVVESYRILRGASPDALRQVAEVSGSATSWADLTPPVGELCYALEYDTPYDDSWTLAQRSRPKAITGGGRSNVVNVAQAVCVHFAESITLRAVEEKAELTPKQGRVHLYSEIYPLTATYRNVNWTITAGDSLATLDQQGLLVTTGRGDGSVTVRVTARDGSGVNATLTVPVTIPHTEIVAVHATNVRTCYEGTNGEIRITATTPSGSLAYSIGGEWSTDSLFIGLKAGEYTVKVRNEAGEEVVYVANPVVVGQPAEITAEVDTVQISAPGACNGRISIRAKGGSGILKYSITGNSNLSPVCDYTDLCAEIYELSVSDEYGCYLGLGTIILGDPAYPPLTIDSVITRNISVYGKHDGEIRIVASGGKGPLEYSTDGDRNYLTGHIFTNLLAGEYDIAVRDKNGTVVHILVVLTQPESPHPIIISSVIHNHVTAYGGHDGKITVTASGGNGQLAYSISNGEEYVTDSVFTGLAAGEYRVVVTDSDGSEVFYPNNPVVIVQPDAPEQPESTLVIEDFRLQNGAAVTHSRRVALGQYVTGGVAIGYQVCEDTTAVGNSWEAYRLLPIYELSADEGIKTVYMRVVGERGQSRWTAASIRYEAAQHLTIESLVVNNGTGYVTESEFYLQVITAGGIASEMEVTLNGVAWWGWCNYLEFSGLSFLGDEGVYTCTVKVRDAEGEMAEATTTFVYKKAPVKLRVEDFAIAGGSSYTRSRTVSLDHWVDGPVPKLYTASERADLRDAEWIRYEEQPGYTLSEGEGVKTVYFAVTDGRDTSETVSAQILLENGTEKTGLNVRTWPNPVDNILHVMLTDDEVVEETEVRVYTAMGQIVERRTYQGRELSIDVSRYPFGVLYVEFVNNGRNVTKQIVKK